MSPKFEKLLQRIQAVQAFLKARVDQASDYHAIAQELNRLVDSLKQGKLRVKIVSRFPILATALGNCVNSYPPLLSYYEFQTEQLPEQLQKKQIALSASLILQPSVSTGKQPIRYELPINQKILIGRRSSCQIRIPDECILVNKEHLEVIPQLNSESRNGQWQIQDLNSANGTYVNGQRLQDTRILQAGDRITIGYSKRTIKSPEFIFDCQSNPTPPEKNTFEEFLTDCDILYLVINPSQPLAEAEKNLIEQAIKLSLVKSVIVLDKAVESHQTLQPINHNIVAIENWIKQQNNTQVIELKYLPLKPFYPNHQSLQFSSNIQSEINQFYQSPENLDQEQAEEALKEQIKTRFISQCTLIDTIFNQQETSLKKEIEQLQQKLEGKSIGQLQEQLNRVLQQINTDRNQVMQRLKSFEIHQAKLDLVDAKNKHGFIYKIGEFIDGLKPVITKKQENQYELILHSEKMRENETIHTYLTRLCTTELINWATQEWDKVSNYYANGGLNGFCQRADATLNFIPTLEVSSLSVQRSQYSFEVYKFWQDSYIEISNKIDYQEASHKGDIARVGIAVVMALATSNLIPLMGVVNILERSNSQKQARESKQEHEIKSLKSELCNHYQAIGKSMVEKLSQYINFTLQSEGERLSEMVKTASEQIVSHLLQVKKRLDECNAQLVSLKKDKVELLQKIKGE